MKVYFILCFAIVFVSFCNAFSIRNKRQVIPKEFARINIDNYLKNDRAVKFQLKCLNDEGPCDKIGKYLKQTIPELLANHCANCDMSQKGKVTKMANHIQDKFPEDWEKAVRKYQPDLVRPEDAIKLEEETGFKIAPHLIAAAKEDSSE